MAFNDGDIFSAGDAPAEDEQLRRMYGFERPSMPPTAFGPVPQTPAPLSAGPLSNPLPAPPLSEQEKYQGMLLQHPTRVQEILAATEPSIKRKLLGILFGAGMGAVSGPEATERGWRMNPRAGAIGGQAGQAIMYSPRARALTGLGRELESQKEAAGVEAARQQREALLGRERQQTELFGAQTGALANEPAYYTETGAVSKTGTPLPGAIPPAALAAQSRPRTFAQMTPEERKTALQELGLDLTDPRIQEAAATGRLLPEQKPPRTQEQIMQEIDAAYNAKDTTRVKQLQDELKALNPLAQERFNISLTKPEEAQAHKWVVWEENGRQIAGSGADAQARGIKNYADIGAQEQRDIMNARHAVNLMTKRGDPTRPETQGALQLIEALERDGKLGVLASRWNAFLTSGVGTSPGDDPRIISLINKNMLGDTATMLAHFGAAGGRSPQMLQHFLDLANARKMDGPTLAAGIRAMANYMKDRAMLPEQEQGGAAPNAPKGATHIGTDRKGRDHYLDAKGKDLGLVR